MTTQAIGTNGRNRGARRGSTTPPVVSIGSHMVGKDQTPAVVLTAQADPKTVELPKMARTVLDKAAHIISGFRSVNTEMTTLKDDIKAKRGGLSDIVFQLCKLGTDIASKPEHRWASCVKVIGSAEAYERTRFQGAQKLADLPSAKQALGSSWQTYKSQILRCVEKGLNPNDFANGTVFREAASKTGNQSRDKRKARQTAGEAAANSTASGVLESMTLRTELAAAITELVKQCSNLDEDAQMAFANRIHAVSVDAVKVYTGDDGAADEETGATEAM